MRKALSVLVGLGLLLTTAGTVLGDEENADTWPCRQPGWTVGEPWGPGPDDIVPNVPICGETTPEASDEPSVDIQAETFVTQSTPIVVTPKITITPPPTDTE